MTADSDILHGFAFGGEHLAKEYVEQAALAAQRGLSSAETRRLNDALLARLADAKQTRMEMTKREMLDDPAISRLVNTLALVNQAWITTVIARGIKSRPQLRGNSAEELYSAALTGAGTVGGVMNAILEYDYHACGVAAFTPYLARAISNALQLTRKQDRTARQVEARMRPLPGFNGDEAGQGWVDRTTKAPERAAIDHDLLEVVKSVIPRLPSPQQRHTAAWMIDRILTTGELPLAREAAQMQRPAVSRERGRQIMAATVDGIRRQIETDYPQLAETGINGWEQFKQAFTQAGMAARSARTGNGRR